MSRLILLLAILLISQSAAYARWALVAISDDDDRYYVDLSTRKFSGDSVKVWMYINYSHNTIKSILGYEESASAYRQYDCKNEQERSLYLVTYSKPHLKGNVVTSGNVSNEWQPIPPNTASKKLLSFVCEK